MQQLAALFPSPPRHKSPFLCCREDEAQAARGGGRRTTKTVVFSYSTKALDLLQSPLRVQG